MSMAIATLSDLTAATGIPETLSGFEPFYGIFQAAAAMLAIPASMVVILWLFVILPKWLRRDRESSRRDRR